MSEKKYFCYIKYLTGPFMGKKQEVSSEIINKFDPKNYKKDKTYFARVKNKSEQITIIAYSDSQETLKMMKSTDKRLTAAPQRYNSTCSESELVKSTKKKVSKFQDDEDLKKIINQRKNITASKRRHEEESNKENLTPKTSSPTILHDQSDQSKQVSKVQDDINLQETVSQTKNTALKRKHEEEKENLTPETSSPTILHDQSDQSKQVLKVQDDINLQETVSQTKNTALKRKHQEEKENMTPETSSPPMLNDQSDQSKKISKVQDDINLQEIVSQTLPAKTSLKRKYEEESIKETSETLSSEPVLPDGLSLSVIEDKPKNEKSAASANEDERKEMEYDTEVDDDNQTQGFELEKLQPSHTSCHGRIKESTTVDSTDLKLKKDSHKAHKKLKQVMKENEELIQSLINCKKELENSRKLNESLAKSLNIKFHQQKGMNYIWDTIMAEAPLGAMTYAKNFPPLEIIKEDPINNTNEVHIGRNVWIPESKFNRVLNDSKTPRQFAGNILLPVFDEKKLLNSTISGFTSSRNGKRTKCDQLDPQLLGACGDMYIHWVMNTYAESAFK
ncbi:hypothetical protein TKK_0009834 [Trichogramma kaykai]